MQSELATQSVLLRADPSRTKSLLFSCTRDAVRILRKQPGSEKTRRISSSDDHDSNNKNAGCPQRCSATMANAIFRKILGTDLQSCGPDRELAVSHGRQGPFIVRHRTTLRALSQTQALSEDQLSPGGVMIEMLC